MGGTAATAPALIVTVGARACAIPIRYVGETMRPLPIEAVAGTPPYIPGLTVIRGVAVPVVDLGRLLQVPDRAAAPGRFVTVAASGRQFALAVDGVLGLRQLEVARLEELPPLVRDDEVDLIEAIDTSDAQFLIVLRAARIVPDDVWAALTAATTPAEAR